ncbi:N-terminal kinase-like protein isoform X1 [Acyrthosiphon pisum]|uniref:N-terminal kinase-like protein n=1 Tax=Acyrthosiphon pisum TaxID=7029 RepID=A0A8R2A474_ACYPI|nr:N-terminal kinase-like protein isoform X1 [Acyrthosiphon pisum]|eukprot:XP_001949439.2 PREDICTED: N-terminal kinase-like protein [Acyrthosiphon pisum]
MWTIFSRDSSKDFPYEISESPKYVFNEKSLWKLNKGKKKNTTQEVSIFEFLINDDIPGSETRSALAKSAVKHLKTLKHPNILSFLESSEVKTIIYLCTEYVEPLQSFISSQNNLHTDIMNQYIAWGISNIIEGLKFLNFEAKLCHNKVNIWSVFVNKAGQWKLGELEYMNSVDNSPPSYVSELYCAPGHRQSPFSIDIWGLGVLIWEVFNGPLSNQSALKIPKKIPKEILTIYPKLVAVDPMNRPSYDIVTSTLREQGYFGNDLEKTMTSLSQYHILDDFQRTAFLEKLPSLLETYPKNIALYNVLPSLLEMFNYVKEQKVIFPSMIKLSTMLDDQEFEEKIVPCIVKLFESNDRATRLLLLNTIELYASRLKADLLNTNIFPLLVSGLADASPTIRELTVRSMVYISSKLNHNNLNVELMRHFARLQMKDDQGSIRTNTTVCLGKIAQYLDPKNRSKILSSAFSRALKDPFQPSRMAGVSAFSATQQYYPLIEVSTRVLPALCQVTLDPEKGVRDITFQTIKGFLGKLENVSEDARLKEKMEEEVANTTSPAIPTWAGWAVTTVTSKFYSSKIPQKDEKSVELSKNNLSNTSVNNCEQQMHSKLLKDNIVKNVYKEKQIESINTLQDTQNHKNSMKDSSLPNDWDDNSGWNVGDDWESIGVDTSNSIKDKSDFGWEDQEPILLDDTDELAKKAEAELIKEEMRKKREERKQERIKQLESKRSNKQSLKLGGKRL